MLKPVATPRAFIPMTPYLGRVDGKSHSLPRAKMGGDERRSESCYNPVHRREVDRDESVAGSRGYGSLRGLADNPGGSVTWAFIPLCSSLGGCGCHYLGA